MNGATLEQAGTYKIGWRLGYAEFPEALVDCTVPVQVKSSHSLYKLSPPRPYIKLVDNIGNVRVAFTRPILMPTFNSFPEFEQEEFMQQNFTNGSSGHSSRRLNATSNSSSELIQSLEIMNRGLLKVNFTYVPVVNLEIIAGPDSDQSKLEFKWKCVDFKPDYMDFVLNFTNFGDVSINE